MIRINLLAVERERTKKRVILPAAHRVTVAATLILIGTALLVGWWFWSLRQQSARLDDELARAEVETRKVRSVLDQVRKFESQKALLQQRVSLIEQLRQGQSAPVHILDEISKSLPERLWLVDLSQTGPDFTLSGTTDSLTAVSDFVANLEGTRWFRKPVEIVDSQVQADAKAGDLIRFQLKAQFVDPNAPAAPPAPAAPAGRGRGGRSAVRDQAGTHMELSLSKLPWYSQIGAFVVVSAGAVFGFWHFYVSEVQADIAMRQTRLTALRSDITKGVATAKQLPEFQAQVTELESRLENLRQVLPEEKDVADILRRIQGLAVKSNLAIQRFQPGKVVQQKMYAEIPYKVQVEGTYHNLGAFFDQISKFPRIINVSEIAIKAKPQLEPGRSVTAEYVATTFVLQEGTGPGGAKPGGVPKQPSLNKK